MRLQVLLIEDSVPDAEIVEKLLSRDSREVFDVTHVESLREAFEKLAGACFDVALLDFHLPDGGGLAAFRSLREQAPRLPIIVITDLNGEETALAAVREGAQDYLLRREVDRRILVRSIRYAIQRERADRERRESEERYALAAAGAHDGLWDWDLKTGTIHYSPRWRKLLGLSEDEVGESVAEWLDRVHPSDRASCEAAIAAHVDGSTDHLETEHRIRNKNGRYLWVVNRGLASRDEHGLAGRMAGSMHDVTARKRAEEQLVHDASHDGLTGLPNRALFRERASLAIRRFHRDGRRGSAIMFLDLDRFKQVNESLGHDAGDRLLVQIASRLEDAQRPGDTVARLGGDEFAFLLEDVSLPSEAGEVAMRVLESLGAEFPAEGGDLFTSASIGIALSKSGYQRADEMLRDAEIAMYRAKAAGKNRYEVFDRAMRQSAVALLELETELRWALERNEFVMHYQPIVGLGDGRLIGFEALVRWRHPRRGLVAPAQFIAVAEETGLIVPLGWLVLQESCSQLADWQRRYPTEPALAVSINVSGKLFMQDGVVERFIGLLERNTLHPSSLRLEITETSVMDHGDAALQRLTELRALGVQLHIDDFGTGYASLSYLQRFRYDTLKIDRSFISTTERSEDSNAIVQTILALGSLLEMNVIAEGVETAAQAQWLRDLNCPQGQGFWFARPMDVESAEAVLARPRDWVGG